MSMHNTMYHADTDDEPLLIALTSACRRLGVGPSIVRKDADFPPIIRLGGVRGKQFLDRRQFEQYVEAKLGRSIRVA